MGRLRLVAINLAIFVVLFAAAEIGFRLMVTMYPPGGVYLDASSGKQITLQSGEKDEAARPGTSFIHVADEFRAPGEISASGFRRVYSVPDDQAEVVAFMGDSFTWGHGVASGKTFADLYCKAGAFRCLNLSRPGFAQNGQLALLESLSSDQMPRFDRFKLFPMVTCRLESAGNDLGQNVRKQREGGGGDSVSTIRDLLYNSEIIRAILQGIMPLLRENLNVCSQSEELETAIDVTLDLIHRIESAVRLNNPDVAFDVYLISPLWEMSRGAPAAAAFQRAAERTVPLVTRAQASDYFPKDGHLNARGHAHVAETLLSLDRAGAGK